MTKNDVIKLEKLRVEIKKNELNPHHEVDFKTMYGLLDAVLKKERNKLNLNTIVRRVAIKKMVETSENVL